MTLPTGVARKISRILRMLRNVWRLHAVRASEAVAGFNTLSSIVFLPLAHFVCKTNKVT